MSLMKLHSLGQGIYTAGFCFVVTNGEDADDTNFNASFISRENDSSTVGKLDLNEASSDSITDLQLTVNQKLKSPATFADNKLLKTDGVDSELMQETGISVDDSDNVTGVNNLTVDGDLTVSGDTVTLNTATLDVEDKNIKVNKGGNDASSEGAGLTVERTGTDGSLVYEDALTSKYKIGALGSEIEITDVASAQTLTQKTINAAAINFANMNFGTASDIKKLLLPNDTTTNLDLLSNVKALLAYDTTLDKPVYNTSSGWKVLADMDDISAANVTDPKMLENLGLSAVAGSGALTVALKQADGSTDAAAVPNSVRISYRSSTLTAAAYSIVSTAAALSAVLPSTATLGYADGDDVFVHVYSLLFSAASEIAFCGSRFFEDDELVTTVALSTGSDLGTTMYSTTQRTAVPVRYLGYFKIDAITTAGTWTAPDEGSLYKRDRALDNITVVSSEETPPNADSWFSFVGNSAKPTPGLWRLSGWGKYDNSGGSPIYSVVRLSWGTANGIDTTSEPTRLTVTPQTQDSVQTVSASAESFMSSPTVLREVTASADIFLNSRAAMTTEANARITMYILMERVK